MTTPAAKAEYTLQLLAQARSLVPNEPLTAKALAGQALGLAAEESNAVNARLVLAEAETMLGEFAAALGHGREALALAEKSNNTPLAAQALIGLAGVYRALGDNQAGHTCIVRGLALARLCGDIQAEARALNGIGGQLEMLGDRTGALHHFAMALALLRQQPLQPRLAHGLANISVCLNRAGRSEEALAHCDEAMAVATQLNDKLALANSGVARGDSLLLLGRIDEAEVALQEALVQARSAKLRMVEMEAPISLGDLHVQRGAVGSTPQAQEVLRGALAIAAETGEVEPALRAHRLLSNACKLNGDFVGALRHHELFHELDRKLFNEASSRQLKAAQMQFQVEQAERDTRIERERSTELAKTVAQLAALNIALQKADSERSALLDELAQLSAQDSLTGLANRRSLDRRLADEWLRAERYQRSCAVVMADIDHFKRVNDEHGHAVGDMVIRTVAQLLQQHSRHSDLVARYGGEEFALVLPETTAEQAAAMCEHMRKAVAAFDWDKLRPGLSVTLSFGVGCGTGQNTPQAVLEAADANLFRAKRAGRNRVMADG